jgi:hypothetical protein
MTADERPSGFVVLAVTRILRLSPRKNTIVSTLRVVWQQSGDLSPVGQGIRQFSFSLVKMLQSDAPFLSSAAALSSWASFFSFS